MMRTLHTFIRDENGATAIEYALIAGILALGIITSVTSASSSLQGIFSNIATQFDNILS